MIVNRMYKDHLVTDVKIITTTCNSLIDSVVPHATVPLSALSAVLGRVTVTTDSVYVNRT